MERELEYQLLQVGNRLSTPPIGVEELLSLLDYEAVETIQCSFTCRQMRSSLSKVEQVHSECIAYALQPSRAAIVSKFWLDHADPDVKVGVTACICEIIRIMAPRSPYIDVYMKLIFERIVDAFERLDDVSSRSFSKRVAILQSVAEVRSFTVMLHLECHDLILKMFQHFLNTIRPENSQHVFPYMEAIMTILLEERGDIPSDLVTCLLESVKVDGDNLPVAHRLGEKVISNCGAKLKPRLRVLSKSLSLRDYSPLVLSLFDETEHIDVVAPGDIKAKKKQQTQQTVADELPQKDEAEVRREDENVAQGKLPEVRLSSRRTVIDASSEVGVSSPSQKSERVGGVAQEIAADDDADEADRAQDPKEGDESNNSGKEPILPSDEQNKQNSAGTSAQSPEDVTPSKIEKKAPMTSARKSHKNKGKQEDIGSVRSINTRARGKKEIAPAPRIALDESLVGSRIKVWWPQDRQFYPGTVGNYDSFSKKHRILYDDGDVEILLMKKERWEFLYPEDKMAARQAQDQSDRGSSLPEERQRKRAKTSSSSGSKGSARGTASAPPKRRGRPPKALSLGGGSSSAASKALLESGTKRKVAARESKKELIAKIRKFVIKTDR